MPAGVLFKTHGGNVISKGNDFQVSPAVQASSSASCLESCCLPALKHTGTMSFPREMISKSALPS